ncbi:hypothetical protein HDU76_009467 [Blyttiomyces sp. JEL0837]|nr:hypothetical protein HDU76_009467 [Blyttiomyces sp. JEL0837]
MVTLVEDDEDDRRRVRKVPIERIEELWQLVRSKVLKRLPNVLNLLVQAAPFPYALTIKQGFQFRYKLKTKHQIVSMVMHPRNMQYHGDNQMKHISRALSENVSGEEIDLDDEDKDDVTGEEVGPVGSRTPSQFTFVCVDSAKYIHVFDGERSAGRPRTIFGIEPEISQMIFLENQKAYATCSNDKTIKINRNFRAIVKFSHTLEYVIEIGISRDEWIYDIITGKLLDKWLNFANRQITSLIHYPNYDYTVFGCVDGKIKVVNMYNIIVHEFTNQSKTITALAIYPHGPVVIACSLDSTIRMYSLKTFKEVYCLRSRERMTGMEIMDDLQMYVLTRNAVEVWYLNHINTGFSTINTHVNTLQRYKSRNKPARVLVITEDGVIRLMSPVSGKILSTCLPLYEMEKAHDVFYCPRIDRIFVLMETNDIWIIASNLNPCAVIDIWNGKNLGEDLSCISMFEGTVVEENKARGSSEIIDYAIFMAGTKNGQILIFNKFGMVVDRYQLHSGKICRVKFNQERYLLYTCGDDMVLKVSRVGPLAGQFITTLCSVDLGCSPREMSLMDNCICVAAEDGTVHMLQYNEANQGKRIICLAERVINLKMSRVLPSSKSQQK